MFKGYEIKPDQSFRQPQTGTISVPAFRYQKFQTRLAGLRRKVQGFEFEKIGEHSENIEFQKCYDDGNGHVDRVDFSRRIKFYDFRLTYPRFAKDGRKWTLVGIKGSGGRVLDDRFADIVGDIDDLHCDACHTARDRNQLFVFVDDEGNVNQVGSSCVDLYYENGALNSLQDFSWLQTVIAPARITDEDRQIVRESGGYAIVDFTVFRQRDVYDAIAKVTDGYRGDWPKGCVPELLGICRELSRRPDDPAADDELYKKILQVVGGESSNSRLKVRHVGNGNDFGYYAFNLYQVGKQIYRQEYKDELQALKRRKDELHGKSQEAKKALQQKLLDEGITFTVSSMSKKTDYQYPRNGAPYQYRTYKGVDQTGQKWKFYSRNLDLRKGDAVVCPPLSTVGYQNVWNVPSFIWYNYDIQTGQLLPARQFQLKYILQG